MNLKNFNDDKNKLSLKNFAKDNQISTAGAEQKSTAANIKNNGYKQYVDTVKSGGNGKAVLSSFGKPQIKTPFQGFKEEQRRHIEYITPQMARNYADIVAKTHRLTISDVEKQGILEEATRALVMDAKDRMYGSDLDEYKAISQRFEKSRDVNEHENLLKKLQGMEYRKRKAEDYFLFDRERDIQKGIIAKENRNIEKYKSQLNKLNREQFTPEKGIVNRDALKEKYGIEQKENGEEKVLTGNERFDNILYSGAFEDAAGRVRRAQLQSEYFERQLKPFEKIRNEINEPGGKEILQRRYQNDMDFRNEFDNLIKRYQQFAKVAPVIENNFNEAVKEYESEVNISNKKAVMGERNYIIETLTKEALGILEFSKASEEGREKAKKQGWKLPDTMPRYVNGEYIPHSMDDSFSENEQNIYYALFNVNPQKAAQYRKALTERYAEDWHNEEAEKIISNPLSAGVTLAVSDILKYPEAVINTITGGKLTASGYKGFGELSNRIKGNMIKNSDGAGRKIIETGLGIGDMLAAQIAAGGKGVKIASALMGTNAASGAMDSARARGGNEAQIYASGVAAGTIEYLLNKLGTERLLNMIGKPSRSILKAMVTNGVSEFAEEFLTEIAQNLSDTGIMGNKSQLSNYINSLIKSGMGEDEAKKTAIKDMFLNQPFDSGIVGFLTGSIMGGGNAAISTVSEGMQAIKNPNEFINYTDSIINSDVSSLSGEAEKLRSEVERYRNKAKNSKHTLGTLINSGKAMAAAGEFSGIPKVIVQREGLQKSERTFLERLSKITKANIIYTEIPNAIGETGVLKGGIFSAGDNTILIDYRTSAADILKFVAGHEAGHSSEGTKWHNALKNFVKSEMGEEYESAVNKKIETHKKAGNILSRTDAENEVVSDYAGKVLSEEGVAERMAKRDYGTAKLFLDSIKDIGNKIKTSFGKESASGIEEGARLLERALGMRNPLQQALSVQYSIDENFINNYNKWVENGRPDRQTLTVGKTSEALKSINVKDQEIKWDTSKINASLKKHKYLNDGILKQIPNLLENPIIVMQAKEFDSRITMFGEVYDTDGLPIMAVLELLPTNRQGTVVLDEIKLVSTHSRKDKGNVSSMAQTQNLINESDIYYVEPNKKRTNTWLKLNRLQLPLSVTKYGPIKMITYPKGNVNTYNMQNEKNNSDEKNEMQIALEKAGIDSSMFEGNVKNSVTELTDEQREAVREAERLQEKAGGYIRHMGEKEKDDTSLSRKLDRAAMRWVDRFQFLKRFDEAAKNSDSRAYMLAMNSLNSDGTVMYVIKNGMTDMEGNTGIGKSLFKILEPLKSKQENKDFEVYLVAKHAEEWLSANMGGDVKIVFGDETLDNIEAVRKIYEGLETKYPHFKSMADEIYEFQRTVLLNFGVRGGLLSEADAERFFEMYPKYIPFYRSAVDDGLDGIRREFADLDAGILQAEGGTATLESPIESIIRNTAKFVGTAKKNAVMQEIYRQLERNDGFEIFADIIPESEYESEAEERAIRREEDVASVMIDGVRRYIRFNDTDLLKTVTGMNDDVKLGKVWAFFAAAGNVFKTLTTSGNAMFSLGSNVWRDIDTAYKSSNIINPAKFAKEYGKALYKQFENDKNFQRYLAMGGRWETSVVQNRDAMKKLYEQLHLKNDNGAKKMLYYCTKGLYNGIQSMSDMVETTPRFMEFVNTLNKTGDIQKAIYDSGEVTTNFKRRGTSSREVEALLPYTNSRIQGTKKLADLWKEKPMQTAAKMMSIATVTSLFKIALRELWDEEEYKDLSTYTKDNFHLFAIGNGKYFSIPKSQNFAIFDTIADRTVEFFKEKNPDAYKNLTSYVLNNLLPVDFFGGIADGIENGIKKGDARGIWSGIVAGAVDTVSSMMLIGTVVQLMGNRDFKGSKIVPSQYSNLSPEEQYDENTTYIARLLGKAMGMSPFKIDHVISSNFGYIGKLNESFGREKKDYFLGLGNKFIKSSVYSNEILSDFYDKKSAVDTEYATAQVRGGMTGELALEKYFYNGAASVVSNLYKLQNDVKTPKEKEEIRREINNFVKRLDNSKYGEVNEELSRLYLTEENGKAFPFAALDISVDEWGYSAKLDAKSYMKAIGNFNSSIYKEFDNAIKSDAYKGMSDKEKMSALTKIKSAVKGRCEYEAFADSTYLTKLMGVDKLYEAAQDIKTRSDYLDSIKVFYPEDVSKNFEAADMESAYGFIKYLEKENSLTGESAQAINKYLKERQKSEEYQGLKKILLDNCISAESFAPLARNYENIFKWSKNGQKYKLEIKPDEVVKIMKVFDTYVYSTYEKLYKEGYYTEKSGMGKVTNANGKKVNATWKNMSAEQRNDKLSDYRSRCIKNLRKVLAIQKNYKVTKEE